MSFFSQTLSANIRNLDDIIQSDRDERILRINELTVQLNTSLLILKDLSLDLENSIKAEKESHGLRVIIRNGAAAIAAIGFVSTALYQSRGINTSKIILSGGYALSSLSAVVSYFQNKSLRFSQAEIESIRASVVDLEGKVEIEKRNLAREIKLLCMSDGGSTEACEQFN